MYLVIIINTNGMTERGKNIKTKSDIRSCINQTRNTPIGGIKDKDCSIKNNLFTIGESILFHSLLEKYYWCSSQILLYITSEDFKYLLQYLPVFFQLICMKLKGYVLSIRVLRFEY